MVFKKKISLTAILAIGLILLGVAGSVYAYWSQYLYMYGYIWTGNQSIEITSVGVEEIETKTWVANTTTTRWDSNDDGYDDSINVTILNGYPCYAVYLHITVWNRGSVPIRLQNMTTDAPACFDAWISDGFGEQIDADDHRDYTAYIHILQCATENTTYTFFMELEFVNFNEYVPPP